MKLSQDLLVASYAAANDDGYNHGIDHIPITGFGYIKAAMRWVSTASGRFTASSVSRKT